MSPVIMKTFDQLTTQELYNILQARSQVFVVEQQCVYLDIDGTDKESLHFFVQDDNENVVAYLRLFQREANPHAMQIGRVLTIHRGIGLGKKLLDAAIEEAARNPQIHELYAEAQTRAEAFYKRAGFTRVSDIFLEDGIPHVLMFLELK